MTTLSMNLRHALRRIRLNPGYSLTIVLCLGLGIGANTALFTLVNNLLLRPMPTAEPDRLVRILLMREGFDPLGVGYLDYELITAEAGAFESTGLAHRESYSVLGDDRAEQVEAARVTASYLPMLGVRPVIGRLFSAEDDRPDGPRVALLGHRLWQQRFGGDDGVVGRRVTVELTEGYVQYEVIGVMPPGFDLPTGTQLWVPMAVEIASLPLDEQLRTNYLMEARVRADSSAAEAATEAESLVARLAADHPVERNGFKPRLVPLRRALLGDIEGKVEVMLYLLQAVVGFLLLIACANVMSLLLIRSIERDHEMSVQTALGAKGRHLVVQLLTESVVLALLGGAAGMLLAYWLAPTLMALSPVEAVALHDIVGRTRLDSQVLLFNLAVSLGTVLLFGLVPALRSAAAKDLTGHLKEGGQRGNVSRAGRRLLGTLVVVEIALAAILLVGAGLTLRSFQDLQKTELGFDVADKLTFKLPMSRNRYPEMEQRVAYARRLLERFRSLPGVRDAAMTTTLPMEYNTWDTTFTPDGMVPDEDSEVPVTAHRIVTPGFLELMGTTLLEGRYLEESDRQEDPLAVVVTRELARQYWPDESAVGKRLWVGYPPLEGRPPAHIVGVIADTKEDRFNFGIDRAAWYFSYYQMNSRLPEIQFALRTEGNPLDLVPTIYDVVAQIDSQQAVLDVKTMEYAIDKFLGPQRFSAVLMGAFAVLGLVLAAVGLYGLLAYWVARSAQEIGIRMALGAATADLMRLAIGRGLKLVAVGLVLGLVGGGVLSRVLGSQVEQLRGVGAEVFLTAAAVLALVSLAAVAVPAWRATRVDPIGALRCE